MTHIDRLLKSSKNPRTRALLGAALEDSPPRGSLARVATGLGIVAGTSTWSAMAAGAGTAGTAGAAAASGGALTLLGTGKLLAIGALAGTLVAGASVAVERGSAPVPVTPRSSARPVASQSVVRAVEAGARPESAMPLVETAAPEVPAPERPTNAASGSAASRSGTPPLANGSGALAVEVARIDAARGALARGDTSRALAEIAAYQRERKLGVLDREAALLAVRAHSERGETARAQELARRYLAEHPDDAHAPRLRELVEKK